MATHQLKIDNWHPVILNRIANRHWQVRRRLKAGDANLVIAETKKQEVPHAEGRRRVDLLIVLRKGQVGPDPDAWWKALLDSLVHAKLLTMDTRNGVELGDVTYERTRDESHWTVVTLTDVGPAPKILKHPKAKPTTV